MKRRFLLVAPIVVALGILLAPTTSFAVEPLNLRDVPANDPDRTALEYLNRHDILYGYIDGTIRPDVPITRAELLKVALEANGLGDDALRAPRSTLSFADVPETHTLRPYIQYAVANSIASGYPDGRFKPDAQVTRAEAMKFVLYGRTGCPYAPESPYTDIADSTLRIQIINAYQLGYYAPAGAKFFPTKPIIRREVASAMYRAIAARTTEQELMPGACPDKYAGEAGPATAPSDWRVVGEELRVAVPPGWAVREEMIDGSPSITIDPIAVEDFVPPPDMPATEGAPSGIITITKSAVDPEYPLLDPKNVRIYRTAGGSAFVTAEESADQGYYDSIRWSMNGAYYDATYWPKHPALKGVFYRIVQHAVNAN